MADRSREPQMIDDGMKKVDIRNAEMPPSLFAAATGKGLTDDGSEHFSDFDFGLQFEV